MNHHIVKNSIKYFTMTSVMFSVLLNYNMSYEDSFVIATIATITFVVLELFHPRVYIKK